MLNYQRVTHIHLAFRFFSTTRSRPFRSGHRLQALPQPCHRHAARNGAVRKSAHCQANGCLTEGHQLVPQLAKLISEENTVK